MYTQCPQCQTVFKLSAGVLRQAGGQVRCGRCGEIFNALARLTEDANSLLEDDPSVDLEARADSILESASALKVAEAVAKDYEDYVPPGTEVARLKVLDYWASEDEGDADNGHRRRREDRAEEDPDSELSAEPRHLHEEQPVDPASDTDAGHDLGAELTRLDIGPARDATPDTGAEFGAAPAGPRLEALPLGPASDASDIDELLASLEEDHAAGSHVLDEEPGTAPPLMTDAPLLAEPAFTPEPAFRPESPLTPETPFATAGPAVDDEAGGGSRDAPGNELSAAAADGDAALAEGLVDSAATMTAAPSEDPTAQTDNVEALDEGSLEFTLPPGELDRIFVQSQPWVFRLPEAAQPEDGDTLPPDALESAPVTADEITAESEAFDPNRPLDILLPDALFEAPDADGSLGAARAPAAAASPPDPPTLGTSAIRHLDVSEYERSHPFAAGMRLEPGERGEAPPHPESLALADRRGARRAGADPFEAARRELGELSQPLSPELDDLGSRKRAAPSRARVLGGCAAALLLALSLAAQVVHHDPEWLAEHAQGPLGALLRSVSGAMGAPLGQPAALSAYQVRQWGASGEPGAAGVLRLRASILNAAAQLQPYPLLRVTLADRFGKRIGARDFLPAEYLGKPVARMLAPGERADALLDIVDPGQSAEDFEIDVCLRSGSRIRCANDVATQPKR